MTEFALTLCVLASVGLISIGVLALVAPERLSRSYGVAVDAPNSFVYVRATGARDCIIGFVFGSAVWAHDRSLLLVLAVAGLALSLADFAIAFAFARGFRSEHVAHLGGAAGFLVIAIALLLGAQP